MNSEDSLRELVAVMLMIPAGQVRPETALDSLDTSVGGAKLRLGLKRLGMTLPAGPAPATFGQLVSVVTGKTSGEESARAEAAKPAPRPMPAQSVGNGIQVGIDIQDIQSLPLADDYWSHEFYTGMFAPAEIAYAAVQTEPRVHFAGFWCAKEALRKCDWGFSKVEYSETAVVHDEEGKPYLVQQTPSGAIRLNHALSLSHTKEIATAVVAMGSGAVPKVEKGMLEAEKENRPADQPVPSRKPQSLSGSRLAAGTIVLLLAVIGYLLVTKSM